jgi:hypothetical protein
MNMQDEYNNSLQKILDNPLPAKTCRLFRVKLFYYLDSYMKIKSIKGKRVDLNIAKVLINDIGPSGLKFISNLTLPVNSIVIYNFKTIVLSETINVSGFIVWAEKSLIGLYAYGIRFVNSDNEERHLIKIFNALQNGIHNAPLLSECDFYIGNLIKYFSGPINGKADNLDTEKTIDHVLKYEGEVINGYKKLLDLYKENNGNEEIESMIFNFITKKAAMFSKVGF